MRIVSKDKIRKAVSQLCIKANLDLRKDVLLALQQARRKEGSRRAKQILDAIIENAAVAKRKRLAICQDTGLACVFVELGQDVKISGDLNLAINQGIIDGYKKGYLRNSVVCDPLNRKNPGYAPGVIHIDIVRGNKIKLTLLAKGFGCENKHQLKMFKPTAGIGEIKKFIVETVKNAGPDACPPYVVGVGIGGTADYACFLAKKSLLKKIQHPASLPVRQTGSIQHPIERLENDLYKEFNRLNIGPMGLGGKTTVLGVNILTYPTHIAGLPIAVNINCHALRSASIIL